MRDLGILADWKVIGGSDDFFKVTKACTTPSRASRTSGPRKSATPGWSRTDSTPTDWEDYDFVVIHDPQPAPILKILRRGR